MTLATFNSVKNFAVVGSHESLSKYFGAGYFAANCCGVIWPIFLTSASKRALKPKGSGPAGCGGSAATTGADTGIGCQSLAGRVNVNAAVAARNATSRVRGTTGDLLVV